MWVVKKGETDASKQEYIKFTVSTEVETWQMGFILGARQQARDLGWAPVSDADVLGGEYADA